MLFLNHNRLVLYFLFICASLSTAWADHVVLKNGDRVTGSIVKKDDKNLTVKTDPFGAVTAPWDQVESIVADKPLNIVLRDGRTFQGTLATTDGKVEVTTAQTRVTVALAEIATIRNADEQKAYERLLHPGLGELWTGTGTIGFSGTAGNSRTLTYTTGLTADRVTKTDHISLYFNAIKASALIDGKNTDTAQAVRGGISYGHNVNPRLFVSVFNNDEYDQFQDLDLRFTVGGGLGFHALKAKRSSLDLVAGGDYSRSRFSTPLTQDSAEFYWGDEYTLKLLGATSLTQSYKMFNDLTQTGVYRVNFDIGLGTKILKWLSWNVSLSDRYLSNPVPGRKTNDFLYTTGIGITFAR